MYLLHLLPDAFLALIVNLTLVLGIAVTVFGFYFARLLLVTRPYQTPIKLLGIAILVLGVYWKGGYSVEMIWRNKVAELETKLAVAEEKSKQVNTVIEEKIVYRTKQIKEIQYKTKEVIKEKEKIINAECRVPAEAIDILNAAAAGKEVK